MDGLQSGTETVLPLIAIAGAVPGTPYNRTAIIKKLRLLIVQYEFWNEAAVVKVAIVLHSYNLPQR